MTRLKITWVQWPFFPPYTREERDLATAVWVREKLLDWYRKGAVTVEIITSVDSPESEHTVSPP